MLMEFLTCIFLWYMTQHAFEEMILFMHVLKCYVHIPILSTCGVLLLQIQGLTIEDLEGLFKKLRTLSPSVGSSTCSGWQILMFGDSIFSHSIVRRLQQILRILVFSLCCLDSFVLRPLWNINYLLAKSKFVLIRWFYTCQTSFQNIVCYYEC